MSSRPTCTLFCVRVGKPEKISKRRTIQICSDSQAALLAIESSKVKSRHVLECKKTLNDPASCNKLILTLVPGHSGVRGNEEDDRMTREGSAMYPIAGAHNKGTILNGGLGHERVPSQGIRKFMARNPGNATSEDISGFCL
ncbi:hypothetical protein NQ317_010755 [Molorchus minor]|uniref:RNase H type-1 domain-containing protein n=1 Tax=Molorchus minor TaxID=1323400 RepID=A0ABQ9J2X7_9CUCU|nr:hypothetical protein NQ317_010755 [Molorchus minor]